MTDAASNTPARTGPPSDGNAELEQRLATARTTGDADELADALARHANLLVRAGKFAAARAELDEAAAIHRRRGRVYDEARTTHLAASLSRMAGDLAGARSRARRALDLVGPDTTIAVSALSELGEDAVAEGKLDEAPKHFAAAIGAAQAASLTDAALATLYRRRATVLAAAHQNAQAIHDFERAREHFARAGDVSSAVRVHVEQATAVQQSGDLDRAERISAEARQAAERVGDQLALADLDLLDSARAVDRRDLVAALAAARSARQHALQAVAPPLYVAAALAIAELSEKSDDRLGAYDALATGWATVGDLLGHELARATFEPKVRALQTRWGAEAFAAVKVEYEARQRAALATPASSGEKPGS
jgi:tetratricopeptide (TPR) repeat protein